MMDVKEKLVDMIRDAKRTEPETGSFTEYVADHLIANGVTVHEWISVKDKLPEDDEVVIICTDKNFVYAGELIGDTWFLDNDSWTATVTHWMPLPNPPKGE